MSEPLRFPAEVCEGCGATAPHHPIVGITSKGGVFVSVPVCIACWRDPAHRTTPIKAHFFRREDADRALARAGSADLG